eukprot:UN04493
MVTFTCVQCQWTGKKKQVEKHYNQCGGEYFSCVDCGKTFAEDYAKHTSCIDEEDKYHGKWAKSRKKEKNRINHRQIIQNQKMNQKKSNSSNGNNKKRQREQNENNNPPSKKQKVDIENSTKSTPNQTINATKQNKKKILKKILKQEQNPISLQTVCNKFNEEMKIENKDDNTLFFQTLWKMKDKISLTV